MTLSNPHLQVVEEENYLSVMLQDDTGIVDMFVVANEDELEKYIKNTYDANLIWE